MKRNKKAMSTTAAPKAKSTTAPKAEEAKSAQSAPAAVVVAPIEATTDIVTVAPNNGIKDLEALRKEAEALSSGKVALLDNLRTQREAHQDAITQIDDLMKEMGEESEEEEETSTRVSAPVKKARAPRASTLSPSGTTMRQDGEELFRRYRKGLTWKDLTEKMINEKGRKPTNPSNFTKSVYTGIITPLVNAGTIGADNSRPKVYRLLK